MVAAALLGVAVSSTPKAQAANLTWNQTGAGPYSWTDSANWGGTGFPNAIVYEAFLRHSETSGDAYWKTRASTLGLSYTF
jgi:hypothetical protein